jgi:outer membrane protein assembly factor BamB
MAQHTPRNGGRDCPSPIVVGKFIIVCDMGGVATCYDAKSGEIYWKQRLPGKYSGSPIAANGLAYFLNEAGKTVVIEPGETLKIVAENDLPSSKDEIFRASPTPLGGQLFLRSTTVLYCVEEIVVDAWACSRMFTCSLQNSVRDADKAVFRSGLLR